MLSKWVTNHVEGMCRGLSSDITDISLRASQSSRGNSQTTFTKYDFIQVAIGYRYCGNAPAIVGDILILLGAIQEGNSFGALHLGRPFPKPISVNNC